MIVTAGSCADARRSRHSARGSTNVGRLHQSRPAADASGRSAEGPPSALARCAVADLSRFSTGAVGRELLAVVLTNARHALRHRLLRAGEHHVDAEELGSRGARRAAARARRPRRCRSRRRGGGEGDVEQQRDVEDQRDRREELQDRQRGPLMPASRRTQHASSTSRARNIGRSGQLLVGPLS